MNSTPSLQSLACAWAGQQAPATATALQSVRDQALARLRDMHFPDRKTEDWKYTSLHKLANASLWQATVRGDNGAFQAPDNAIQCEAALRLQLVNGVANIGSESHPAVSLTRLDALDAPQLERYLGQFTLDGRWTSHPFAQLATTSAENAWLLVVKAGQKVEKPVVIEQWAQGANCVSNLRLLVIVEAGAEAILLQVTDNTADCGDALFNGLIQIQLQDNAGLQHLQLQIADESCHQLQSTQTTLSRDSRYQHYAITLGTQLVRNDLHLQFNGNGGDAVLNGAFLSKHSQHVDNHLNLEHISGRCQSVTRYKGLVTDSSRAVFNGRIHIHPGAQKTDAQLNNKNLLLSRDAEIDTKPELEIYADDVKCSHGASIGQLDEKALFYFESRGIDKATAEAMLSFGFINEIVETLPLENVAHAITQRLVSYFRDVTQVSELTQVNELWPS